MSWRTTIVDTNVVLIANGQHQDVTPACVTACTLALQKIKDSERIALDDRFLILREYEDWGYNAFFYPYYSK